MSVTTILLFTTIGLLIVIANLALFTPFIRGHEQKHFPRLGKIETSLPKKPSRASRALKLDTERVCSNSDCFLGLRFTEADIQNRIDVEVGRLIMDGKYTVLDLSMFLQY